MTSGFLIIAFFWLLNFGISWFNAWGAGKAWAEAKAAGGWFRFMTWMAAAMSACGFIWCYLVFEALALNGIGFLDAQMTKLVLEAGYLILAPAIVGIGFTITVDSWARAFRNGGVVNYGVAVYNTYAQYHNTMSLVSNFGEAFKDVGDGLFSSKGGSSSKSKNDAMGYLIIILLVLLAVILGILTTAMIIKKSAGTSRLRSFEELEAAKARR
jgi:hypothetical protein